MGFFDNLKAPLLAVIGSHASAIGTAVSGALTSAGAAVGGALTSAGAAVGGALTSAGAAVSGAVSAIGGAVLTAVAPIAIPVAIGAGIGYGAKKIWNKIRSLSNDASVNEVKNVAQILREYSDAYTAIGAEIERQAKERVDEYFDFLIEKIEENEELANSFGIKNIKASRKNLMDKINGTMTNAIALSFSLDNAECRKILEMAPGEGKDTAMENFVRRVIAESKEELCVMISDVLNQQTVELVTFLENYVKSQEDKAADMIETFGTWGDDMENQSFDIERAQLPAYVKIYAIEQIKNKIAA